MSPTDLTRLRRYLREAVWIAVISLICGAITVTVAVDTFRKTSSLTNLQEQTAQTAKFVQDLDQVLLTQTQSAEAEQRLQLTRDGRYETEFQADDRAFGQSMVALQSDLTNSAGRAELQQLQQSLIDRQRGLQQTMRGGTDNGLVLEQDIQAEAASFRQSAIRQMQSQAIEAVTVQHKARTQLSMAVALAFACILAAMVVGLFQSDQRRRMVRKLQSERLSAIAANRTKSSFLAYTSHELRTPLNAIIGFSEFMMMEYAGPLSDRQKQYLSDIRGSGLHLQALISDILDLTKAEAGKITLNRQKLDIVPLVQSCLKLIEGQANEAGVNLHVELEPGLPSLDGDELRCKQVLINICANAIQFTPKGGDVTLNAALEPSGAIRFVIADTGRGISREDLPKVIEPYYRSGIDEPSHKGYGLGLPLARKIVELHGGTLSLASEVGKGTVVTIILPQAGMPAITPAPIALPLRPGNIISFRRKNT